MTDQFWLWLGFALMAAGAAAILVKGGRKTPEEEMATVLHGTVPIIAACSYFAMAVGQGSIPLHSTVGGGVDYNFYFARYIDWTFTTPLLLASLTLTSMHGKLNRPGLMVGVLIADVIMILTALFFGLSSTAWIKWTWYLISCGAFVAVYYAIWVGMAAEANLQRDDVRATFKRNASILSVLWFIYPLILLVDPEGLHIIGSTLTTALIMVLDVTSKVVYGLLATAEHKASAERDVREGHGITPSAVPAR